jgi:hypothetical protein
MQNKYVRHRRLVGGSWRDEYAQQKAEKYKPLSARKPV